MTVIPIRPVFQNGQRLTAERLTQALEFLRTMLRRVLLAPLSSGVAGGFELTPTGGVLDSKLEIAPGLAIDGQGRLIVVPEGLIFSLTDITAGASIIPTAGTVVRICLAQRESAGTDPCSPLGALGVEEGFEVLFREQAIDEALFDIVSSYVEPNSVAAWGDLDPPFATPEDSCVTLGHIIFADAFTFSATAFYCDGVSPRFQAIRNTAGTPSILLNEFNLPSTSHFFGGAKVAGVAIPVAALFGPNPVLIQGQGLAVTAPAYVKELEGEKVQATRVSRYQTEINAGQVSPGSARVFEFAGGAETTGIPPVQSGLAGVSAVPIEFDSSNGPVNHAGVPLIMLTSTAGDAVRVQKLPTGSSYPTQLLVGVSAGPAYVAPGGTTSVVPVARSGVVRVLLDTTGGDVPQSSRLAAQSVGNDVLIVEGIPTGPALVRSAQSAPMSPSPVEILAWIL
jgi:hypothetical protein